MKRAFQSMLMLTLLLAMAGLNLPMGAAHEDEAPHVIIHSVWARPAMVMDLGDEMGDETGDEPMATAEAGMDATPEADMGMDGMGEMVTSAAYMQIENHGEAAITLVAAASDVAAAVEVHEVTMVDNVMQMRPVEGGIVVPAGETVSLQPGGYHIMLIGVIDTLEVGDAFSLTLTFKVGADEPMDMVLAALVRAEPPAEAPIVVYGTWARAAVGGDGATSAAYMTIENRGEAADRLVLAESIVAAATEIHEMSMNGEVMVMRPVEGGLEIPAGEMAMVELKPGGYHIMFIGVPEDLVVGQAVTLKLTFESGLEIELAVPVRDQMEMTEGMGGMSH